MSKDSHFTRQPPPNLLGQTITDRGSGAAVFVCQRFPLKYRLAKNAP